MLQSRLMPKQSGSIGHCSKSLVPPLEAREATVNDCAAPGIDAGKRVCIGDQGGPLPVSLCDIADTHYAIPYR